MRNSLAEWCGHASEVNRHMLESALGYNEIGARTRGLLARQQLALVQTCIDSGERQLGAAMAARNPADFVFKQLGVFSEVAESIVENMRETVDIQIQARVEIGLCLDDSVNTLHFPRPAQH